jgi:hypothetical protein
MFDAVNLALDRGEEFPGDLDQSLDVVSQRFNVPCVFALRYVVQIADVFVR